MLLCEVAEPSLQSLGPVGLASSISGSAASGWPRPAWLSAMESQAAAVTAGVQPAPLHAPQPGCGILEAHLKHVILMARPWWDRHCTVELCMASYHNSVTHNARRWSPSAACRCHLQMGHPWQVDTTNLTMSYGIGRSPWCHRVLKTCELNSWPLSDTLQCDTAGLLAHDAVAFSGLLLYWHGPCQ